MKNDVLLLIGRLMLSVFFVAEAFDKIDRFQEWTEFIAKANMPFPEAEMVLVIALLVLGSACLITGWKLKIGSIMLVVFLVPTALLFEPASSAIKSVSLIGALFLIMASGPGRFALGGTLKEPPKSKDEQ